MPKEEAKQFEKPKTQYVGVRYREHPTRKHNGKPDRYFMIRYRVNGQLKEEGLGWSSQEWNAQKASSVRNDLIKGHKIGEGPQTLSEKRQIVQDQKKEEEIQKETADKQAVTFASFFDDTYFPNTAPNKTARSNSREKGLFKNWIESTIGKLRFVDISILHLEQIKQNMADKGQSARSIRYALAVIRQTFNYAKFVSTFSGPSPVENVKFPQADNKRLRFLTKKEAEKLLSELNKLSPRVYEMAMLSLRTGARADEIFSLKWGDVDLIKGTLILWDTKNTKTRMALMTQDVKDILTKKQVGEIKNTDLVFPGRQGVKSGAISRSFHLVVKKLGFNEGITDRRMKVVFHSLRHTYASWLVEKGQDLYTIKQLLGHSSISMTERYAHVSNNTLQSAVMKLDAEVLNTTVKADEPKEEKPRSSRKKKTAPVADQLGDETVKKTVKKKIEAKGK